MKTWIVVYSFGPSVVAFSFFLLLFSVLLVCGFFLAIGSILLLYISSILACCIIALHINVERERT